MLVEWLDSRGCSDSWEDVKDLKVRVLLCRTVGWLVKEDKAGLILAPSVAEASETAELALFLAGPGSSFIYGQVISHDGGWS